MENAPSKFHRLKPGGEVRLRYGYIVKCERVVKDAAGNVVELRCSHDPTSRSGSEESGRKVKGTIHWVSAKHARYARSAPLRPAVLGAVSRRQPREGAEPRFAEDREPARRSSLHCSTRVAEERFQFERLGYFVADACSRSPARPCSTARSRCATPGPSSSRKRSRRCRATQENHDALGPAVAGLDWAAVCFGVSVWPSYPKLLPPGGVAPRPCSWPSSSLLLLWSRQKRVPTTRMRCRNGRIINVGMSSAEVIGACGQPKSRTVDEIPVQARSRTGNVVQTGTHARRALDLCAGAGPVRRAADVRGRQAPTYRFPDRSPSSFAPASSRRFAGRHVERLGVRGVDEPVGELPHWRLRLRRRRLHDVVGARRRDLFLERRDELALA